MLYIKRSRFTRFVVVPVTLLALFSGCAYNWSLPGQPPADYIRAQAPSQVRLTLKDNRQFVVKNPTATDSTISWSEGDTLATIRLDELRSLEYRQLDAEGSLGKVEAILIVASVLALIPLLIACDGIECLKFGN